MGLLAASCAKEKLTPSHGDVPAGFEVLDLVAGPEDFTKTAISGDGDAKEVSWVKGDQIKIFYEGGSTTAQSSGSGMTATFRATVPSGADLYAVYPADAATFGDKTLNVSVPAQQDGSFALVHRAISKMKTDGSVSTFYNATSFFKIVVNDAAYTKLVVSALGTDEVDAPFICGNVAYTFDAFGNPVAGAVTDGASKISVNLTGKGTYYVTMLPDAALAQGVLIDCYKGEQVVNSYYVNRNIQVPRSVVASFGDIAERAATVYVSVAGAGTKSGKDWANAMDKNGFVNLVGYEMDHKTALAKAAMLRGVTFKMEGGIYTYNVKIDLKCTQGSETIAYTVDGGYYNGLKDVQNHPTIFSGNNDHAIFYVGENMNITYNDCQFVDAKGSSSNDAAVKLSSKDAVITMNRCVFDHNTNSARSGAIGIANGYAYLNDCVFTNNTASEGAAFCVDNEGCGGEVVVNGGRFENNTATSYGGCISIFGGGPLTVTGATFTDNSAANNGGVFSNQYGAVETTFNNCEFGAAGHGNTAKHGGVLFVKGYSVACNRCSFVANSSTGDGGAVLANSSATASFKGCTFDGNSGVNGGCFDIESSATVTIEKSGVTASVIKDNTGKIGGAFNVITGGVVTLNDCTVSGNTASGDDKSKGGAVYLNGGSSKIYSNNTTFTANIASGKEGGAITAWSSAKVYVNGGTFSENKSKWGPAIELESSARAEVSGNAVFTKNVASGPGGAMFVSGSTAIVSGASFIENSAATFGGAILTKNGTLEATECIFKGNYSNGSSASNYGGAISLGDRTSSGTNGKITAKLNKCFFTGNHAYDGGAICMNDTGANIYMNACSFYKDYCTESAGGATMYYNYGTSFNMNNCTVLDGTWNANGSSSINEAWFYFNRACKFTISNCTFIGDLRKTDGGAAQTAGGLLRFKNGNNTGYSINNIIAPKKDGTFAAYIAGTFSCTSYYTKRAGNSGGSNWNSNSTDGYNALSSAFGGLTENANANGTYADNYYSWNGTMSGIPSGSQNNKAQLSDVNAQIQASDADFYAWLNTIGALDKDQLGNARGTETWPGAYDGSNN